MKYIVVILVLVSMVLFYLSLQYSKPKEDKEIMVTQSKVADIEKRNSLQKEIMEKEKIAETKPTITDVTSNDKAEKIVDDEKAFDEENDDAPVVRREKLIGGADIEWEEPKPRSLDDKFGEPPM